MTGQALAIPNPSLILTAPIGSLEAYVERVSAIPMLDREIGARPCPPFPR